MADGHVVECSVFCDTNLVSVSSDGDTTPESRIEEAQEAVSTIRDKLDFAWTGDFPSLKRFVNERLRLTGVWSQPGGDKKSSALVLLLSSGGKTKKFCPLVAQKLIN